MKINSTISGSIGIQNNNSLGDKQVWQKSSPEIDAVFRKISDGTRTDVDSGNVINDEMLDNAVEQANKSLRGYDKFIERTVHEKTHTIIYVLRDTETNEVIREFPPRKIQDMIAKMWEMAGILVDERR